MPEIFISYAREDSAFVRQLVDTLKAKGRDVWVDFDDIPFASEWWKEVVEGIESSSTGIFVISADSISSQYCSLEIAELIKNKKKLIPIVTKRPGEEQMGKLPQTIRNLNWVFFDNPEQFEKSFSNLLDALDTDLELAKEHTRLLLRANDWKRHGENRSLLARGQELAEFLPMLEKPTLTTAQKEFLEESLVQAEVQQRLWRFICGFLGGLLGLSYFTIALYRGMLSPTSVLVAIAAGEFFGVFTGIIAVFANDVPVTFQRFIPAKLHLATQIFICLLVGMLAWISFKWAFLNLPPTPSMVIFMGGLGLAFGFIIHAIFKPHVAITFLITAISMFLPIYFFNSTSDFLQVFKIEEPLIYFDKVDQVFWVGLPLALLFALGANGQNIYQWLFGADELTEYFNRRSSIFAWTEKAKRE